MLNATGLPASDLSRSSAFYSCAPDQQILGTTTEESRYTHLHYIQQEGKLQLTASGSDPCSPPHHPQH